MKQKGINPHRMERIYLYMDGFGNRKEAFNFKAFKNESDAKKWWTEYNGREIGDIYEVWLE